MSYLFHTLINKSHILILYLFLKVLRQFPLFLGEVKFHRMCLGMIFNHPSSSVIDRFFKFELCLCLGEISFYISLITYFLCYLYSLFLEMISERCSYPESILHFSSRFLTIFYFYNIAVNCRCS